MDPAGFQEWRLKFQRSSSSRAAGLISEEEKEDEEEEKEEEEERPIKRKRRNGSSSRSRILESADEMRPLGAPSVSCRVRMVKLSALHATLHATVQRRENGEW